MSYTIDFEPVGRREIVSEDQSLLEIARQLGVGLVSICGGEGSCGQCRVQVLSGSITPPTKIERAELSEDELAAGYRMACQTYPQSDLKIHLPPESLSAPQRAQIEGLEVTVSSDPPVHAYRLQLTPPSLEDLTADVERVLEALHAQHGVRCDIVDASLLRELSPKLREWRWQVQVTLRNRELIAAGPWSACQLGLAFDLGTTKIAGYLVDLTTGATMVARGTMNPQIAYGEDLITRLTRARSSPVEARRLQEIVVDAFNGLAEEMCGEVGASCEDVVEAVVVANTAMHHLFLRLPAEQLLMAPYVPAIRGAIDVKGRDAGLRLSPGAYLHVLPNIAGYVGADHVAMILATDVWRPQGLVLALDIGTNTEICLSNDGEMVSVSTASGPAFEGAHIKHGMRAASGAVEHVRLRNGRVDYETIGGTAPVGICGSGILDAVAQLYLAGVLNRGGGMRDDPRVREGSGGKEFVLASAEEAGREGAEAIVITQRDVREIQLAKGALRAGIQALLEHVGRKESEIDQVIIAGAFGSYIDPASAVAIGMLPPLPLDRFRQVGNAAGTGARLALISRQQRALAEDIARRVRYIELAGLASFSKLFSKSIFLGQ